MDMRYLLGLLICGSTLAAAPAAAQRAERINRGTVFVTEKCPLSPDAAAPNEAAREFLFAPILGAFAGELIGAGVNALAQALDRATQERGFVAEGISSFYFNQIKKRDADHAVARAEQRSMCLVLYLPAETGNIGDLISDPELGRFNQEMTSTYSEHLRIFEPGEPGESPDDMAARVLEPFRSQGIERMPAVYTEIAVLRRSEGMVIRPVLLWYRQRMPGAPSGRTAAELHVSFGTPASGGEATDIGSIFSAARILLPQVTPGGQIQGWHALSPYQSVIVPARPMAGAVDTTLTAYNADYTAVATRTEEKAVTQRALEAALRLQPGAEREEAIIVARDADARAAAALQAATTQANRRQSIDIGATNVKARFVAVREADRFGQAIATALGARREQIATAATTAITNALTPSPQWEASRTAYIEAQNNLDAKQVELAAATQSGDAAAIVRLSAELRLLQARLNEAAVAAHRNVPYPDLLPRGS
jgi:hypothetical protein